MKKIITALLFFCISNIAFAQLNISDVQPQGGGPSIFEGCLNQTIRIVGTGFQPTGMTMNINTGPIVSTYTYINANTIEFMITPGTSGAGVGVVLYYASFTSNARTLTVSSAPTIISQPVTQTVCEGSPYNFFVSAVGGSSMAYQWRKNSVLTGQTTTTISGSTLYIDSGAVYTVDVINTACPAFMVPSNPATLHVKKMPNNPPTLPNINQCQNGVFTMNATPPNAGSGSWACLSNCGGVNIVAPTVPNTQVNGVPNGVYPQMRWMVTNGPCSAQSYMTLLNFSMPTTTSVISGADTNICTTSSPVALIGNTPTGTYTNVDWSLQGPATGTFGSPTASYTTFTPTSGAGNYVVEYFIRNGACNSISAKQISVHNPPVPDAGGPYTACFGAPFSLSGNAPGANSIFWSRNGGTGSFSAVSGLTPNYSPFGPDSLGVTFAVALNVTNLGCTTPVSDTVTVTIIEKAQANIPAGSDATVCAGGSASIPVNFTGTPPFSGIGLYNGVTNTDLGTISGTTTIFSVTPAASTNYTLSPVGTFVDGLGCPGSWHGSSFITAAPGVGGSINITPAMICSGSNATLAITPTGGGGPGWKVYYNSGGANTVVNVSGTTYSTIINPTSTGTYVVDSIETVGCGRIKVVGITKTVVVSAPPTVSAAMAINVADDTLCQGESTTIEITGVQLNTVYKLIKNYNSVALDSIIIGNTMPGTANVLLPISKFTPGKTDTIRFLARRPGCNVVSSVNNAYVWASALTNPVISASPTLTLCENKILLVTPLANVMYQWYEGGKMIVGATASKDTAFFGGSYSVKAKDTLACKLASNNIDVDYVGHEPNVSVTTVSATETKLSSSSSATTYYWYAQTSTGIKKIQGANGNSISVYFDGNYYLGTITGSCFYMSGAHTVSGKLGGSLLKQSFIETDSTIVLPEMDFSSDARAYPNPISGSDLTIDYIAGDVTKISFILYNPQGFAVVQKEVDGNGLVHTEIPTSGLPTGIYSLYINDGVKQVRKNIMIY